MKYEEYRKLELYNKQGPGIYRLRNRERIVVKGADSIYSIDYKKFKETINSSNEYVEKNGLPLRGLDE